MPFTPFHLGPALLLGLLCYRWLDLPTLLAASVVVDVRTALVYFGYLHGPLHGPFHTLAVSTALGLLLAAGWYLVGPHFAALLSAFHIEQNRSRSTLVGAALVGVWSHVLLDSLLYLDVRPFWPLTDANPFLWGLGGPWTPILVYTGCVVAGTLGLLLYVASVAFPDASYTVALRTSS